MKRKTRREVTLLEVLIALLIVAAALPILVSSSVFIYGEHERFLEEVVIDRIANNAFAAIFEELSANRLSYRDLENERELPLNETHLKVEDSGYKGTFVFKRLKPEKPDKNSFYFVELWRATLKFSRKGSEKAHIFSYDFIVIRDLTAFEGQKGAGKEGGA